MIYGIAANNLLSFMHASALSRGLPHKTVQNLSRLNMQEEAFSRRKEKPWIARLPPNDAVYRMATVEDSRQWKAALRQKEEAAQANHAWNMLLETTKMAEGQSGLVLGRPRFVRYEPPWWRPQVSREKIRAAPTSKASSRFVAASSASSRSNLRTPWYCR